MKERETLKSQAARALSDSIMEVATAYGYTSQAALAALLGITPQYLCDMLKGRRRWGPERLDELGPMLRVTPVQLARWHNLGAQADGWRV